MTAVPDNRTPKPLLDWLRFGAALMVVLGHCKNASFFAYSDLDPASRGELVTRVLFGFTRYGGEAVVAFFVLSGYLVGGAAIGKLNRGQFDIGDYAADRFSRIMLPLVPAVLFTATLHVLFGPPITLLDVAGNLASIQGRLVPPLSLDQPLWSLSFEVWCYIINGALMLLLGGKARIFSAVMLVMGLIQYSYLNSNYLIVWFMGALLFISDDGRSSKLGLVIALSLSVIGTFLWETSGNRWDAQALFVLAFALVLLVKQLANWPVTGGKIMTLGTRLAGFSYSLYLIHYPTVQLVNHILPRLSSVGPESLGLFLLRVAICLAIGWVFYLCFERHTARVRQWLRALFRRYRVSYESRRVAVVAVEAAPQLVVAGAADPPSTAISD